MIRLYPVQYQIPGAQMILFRDGHGTALTGQVLLRHLALEVLAVLPFGAIPILLQCRNSSERYRLIQLSMVVCPTPARRAASRIRSRPARYSSTSETFSSKATSFRLPILYSLPMLFSCLLYWEHTSFVRYANPARPGLSRSDDMDTVCQNIHDKLIAAVDKRLDADAPWAFFSLADWTPAWCVPSPPGCLESLSAPSLSAWTPTPSI